MKKDNNPGPGNYDLTSKSKGPSISFGGGRPSTAKNSTPAPGNYDPNYNVVKDSIKNVKISSSKGMTTSKSTLSIPGPG